MQSKIAHKAERAAFGLALDQIIKAASGPDREKNLDKLLDMAGNLLKDTAPGAIRGVRNGLYPGSKWSSSSGTSSTTPITTCSRRPS